MEKDPFRNIFIQQHLSFQGGTPNYDLYHQKLSVLESANSLTSSVVFIHDFYTGLNPYFSNFPIYLTGYSADELSAFGEELFQQLYSARDLEFISNVEVKMNDIISSICPERQSSFVITLSINLVHKDGHLVPVYVYFSPFLFDDNNRVWMLIGRMTFSIKQDVYENILYIDLLDSNERYIYNRINENFDLIMRPVLTHMEKSVLVLCTRGYLEKEVAREMNISINTVKTHKRNFLRKLEAENISQAFIMAGIHKLI